MDEDKRVLSVAEAIIYIFDNFGERYHYNTLYNWLTHNRLAGFKRGGQWRIGVSAINDFFTQKVKTNQAA